MRVGSTFALRKSMSTHTRVIFRVLSIVSVGAALAAVGPLAGCSGGAQGTGGSGGGAGNGGGGGDGTCIDPGSCPDGTNAGNLPGGPNCGSQTVPLSSTKADPNVLLVIDRSGSMDTEIGNTGVTRWSGLQTSLNAVLDQNAGKARWGLSLFPAGTQNNSCDPGKVDVAITAGGEAAIKAVVNSYSTQQVGDLSGKTPTAATIQAMRTANALVDPTRPNYVVLMTDGQPNCGNADQVTPAIAALYAQSPSVRTFVIGFGAEVNSGSGKNLNEWAVAGHTEQAGPTKYFVAATVADLQNAFQSIVSGVASCTYQLQSPPADASLVAPYIDNQPVLDSSSDGFTYDAGSHTVTFHGIACDKVKAASKVDFIYGCPVGPIL